MHEPQPNISNYHRASLVVSILAACLFLIGFGAWLFNLPSFNSFIESWRPVKPVTCVSGILLAFGNISAIRWPHRKMLPVVLGIVPAAVGLSTLLELAIGSNHALFDFFFQLGNNSIEHPGRMSILSATLFLLLSLAHAVQAGTRRHVAGAQLITLATGLCCIFIFLGHIFASNQIVSSHGSLYMSVHASVGLFLLSIALLLRYPDNGIIYFYRHQSVSIRQSLILLARTIFLLLIVSWFRFVGEKLHWFDSRLGLTFMVTIVIGILFVVITLSARKLYRVEKSNNKLLQRLDQNKEDLEEILNRMSDGIIIVDRQLVVTYVNPNVVRASGKAMEDIIGFDILKLFFIPDLYASYRERIELAFETQQQGTFNLHSETQDEYFDNYIFPTETHVTIFYRNTTAQRKAEQEVIKAKENYQSLVENLNEMVIRTNVSGELLYISPSNGLFLEPLRVELISRFNNELFTSPFPTKVEWPIENSSCKLSREMIVEIGNTDELRVIEVRYSPEYNVSGQLQSILAICRDITETHRTKERNDRLTSIIENMTAMVAQADSSFRPTYINPAGRQMLGIEQDVPPPFDHIAAYTTESSAEFMQSTAFPHALEHGSWTGRSVLRALDGRIIPVMLILVVHSDAGGNFSYISSIAYDLTEIEKQGLALKESEHRWQFAVDGSNLGLWDWDLDTNNVFFSKRYLSILGYDEPDFGNQLSDWYTKIHPDDYKSALQDLNDYIHGTAPEFDNVHRLLKKDGSSLHVRDRGMITERNPDGTPRRMIGTLSDVTFSIQQTEVLNKTKEELRSLAVHLQDIREEERLNLSRMIHEELGQQLTSLKMDLSSFDQRAESFPKLEKQRLEKALRTLETTIQVVKKMSSDLRPSIIEDLGLVAALQSLTQDFQVRFDIRIRFSSLLDNIETSSKTALCLYRVYQEALSNTARHSLASQVAVRLTISDEGMLILAIRDDGVGFNISDKTFTANFGLVEIRERMLMINGELEIRSAPGAGTLLLVKAPMSLNEV